MQRSIIPAHKILLNSVNTRLLYKPIEFLLKSPLLSIVFCICTANWQLLFGLRSIKWDSENYWHPWRYFISECYNNGIVPLWNPYTQAGYPVHGDLQGPAYSIDAILSSFLFNGSVYSINIIYLAYLIFGAYGFYKLSLFVVQNSVSRKEGSPVALSSIGPLLAGIIYSLSGFVTAHGHNLYIVISISLVPWLIYYFFKITNGGKLPDSFKLAIILFFQVTAGNPSFLIVLFYFFTIVFVAHLVIQLKKKEYKRIKDSLLYFAIAAITAVVLCAPVIVNVALIFKDTTRGNGLSVDWAGLENSPLSSIFSFATPLLGFENFVDINIRQPLISYYIGLLSVPLAILGFIKFRSFWLNCLGVFALIGFFVSLGLDTPLFKFLRGHLPFFNVFRMPKLMFIYDVIYLLILFACACCYIKEKQEVKKKFVRFSIIGLVFFSVFSLVYFQYVFPKEEVTKLDTSSVIDVFRTSSQVQKVLASTIIAAFILIVLYVISKGKRSANLLFFLLLLDVGIHYNITAIVRVFSEVKLSFKENYISNLPLGFPVPDNNSPKSARFAGGVLQSFWMNSNIYIKQPEYSNNNSFALSNYALLEEQHKPEFEYLISKPTAFLVDSVSTKLEADLSKINRQIGIVSQQDVQQFTFLQKSTSDTIICSTFVPQKIVYTVSNKNPIGFLLQQNYNSLWKIKLNGKLIEPTIAYYAFPLISLPAGKNSIEFTYEVPYFYLFFCVSLGLFVILIFYLIIKKAKYKWTLLILTLALVSYCGLSFAIGRSNMKKGDAVIPVNKYPDAYTVLNSGGASPKLNSGFSAYCNFIEQEEVAKFISTLPSIKSEHLVISSYKAYFPPELNTFIENSYGKRITSENTGSYFTYVYKKDASKKQLLFEDKLPEDSSLYKGIELKKGNEWGPTLKFKVGDKKLKAYDVILVEADVETDHTEFTGLCLSIENNAISKKFTANLPLKPSSSKKRKLCVIYTLMEDTKKDDEIKVFVWNPNEKSILLHSMKVRVFRN